MGVLTVILPKLNKAGQPFMLWEHGLTLRTIYIYIWNLNKQELNSINIYIGIIFHNSLALSTRIMKMMIEVVLYDI